MSMNTRPLIELEPDATDRAAMDAAFASLNDQQRKQATEMVISHMRTHRTINVSTGKRYYQMPNLEGIVAYVTSKP